MLIRVALEPLSEFLASCPRTNETVTQELGQLGNDFRYIDNDEFKTMKRRICVFKELGPLLRNYLTLEEQTYQGVLAAMLEGNVGRAKAKVKGDTGASIRNIDMKANLKPTTWTTSFRSAWKVFSSPENDIEQTVGYLIDLATQAAEQISDGQFLSQLEQDVRKYGPHFPRFEDLAGKARLRALGYLQVGAGRTLKRLVSRVHRTQEEECAQQIECRIARRTKEVLDQQRIKLISHVNSFSAQTASSCVSNPFLAAQVDIFLPSGLTFSIDNVVRDRKGGLSSE